MNMTRYASRTLAGKLAPLFAGAVAACFIFMAHLHNQDVKWLGMDHATRLFIAGVCIFAAVGMEMIILRQKRLIAGGHVVEAVVDDVRSIAWSQEHSQAFYHFFTEDRRVITSCCAIDNQQLQRWSPGQKITAIYDPARPARHIVNDRLWALRWQVAA